MKNTISKRPNGSTRIQTMFISPTKTQQQFKDDCDANKIIKRFIQTGEAPKTNMRRGVYADTTEVPDLQTQMQRRVDALTAWENLPNKVKARFKDANQLTAFLADPKNDEESLKLGLIEKKTKEPDENLKATQELIKTINAQTEVIKKQRRRLSDEKES